MSIAAATAHSAAHAAIVAAAATAMAEPTAALLRSARTRFGAAAAWSAVLLPVLTPALLVGYAYAAWSLKLVRMPLANEALYVLIMVARFAPVAALVVYLSPPPALSAEARHLAAMTPRGGRRGANRLMPWLAYGPGRRLSIAFVLTFLLAFQEFEIASLMAVPAWTVWLFDAQVGGLPIPTTLRHALLPLLIEAALLTPLAWLLLGRDKGKVEEPERSDASRAMQAVTIGWLGVCTSVASVVPLAIVAGVALGTPLALRGAWDVRWEVGTSGAYAAAASLLAGCVAIALLRRPALLLLAVLPGLLGSLVLGLVLVTAFSGGALAPAYDSPLPWTLSLVLLLMPAAALLAMLLGALRRREALHVAELMRSVDDEAVRASGRRILWSMRGRAWYWALALLATLAYFDLAAGAMLAPSGHTPVTVTLYNLMHYGRNATLSAATLGAAAALVALLAAGGFAAAATDRVSWRLFSGAWSRG